MLTSTEWDDLNFALLFDKPTSVSAYRVGVLPQRESTLNRRTIEARVWRTRIGHVSPQFGQDAASATSAAYQGVAARMAVWRQGKGTSSCPFCRTPTRWMHDE